MTLLTRAISAVRHFFQPWHVSDTWLQSQRLADTKHGLDTPVMWKFEDSAERTPRSKVVPITQGRTRTRKGAR